MTLIISFPSTEQTSLAEVGGKGYSLLQMSKAGLPVPPGAVLTTDFFAPWFRAIQASASWLALLDATQGQWKIICNELKELCITLPLTANQQQALDDLRKQLAMQVDQELFAVRSSSSSPEEDLASASFAGGYETRLGVRPDDLEDAVRYCFASSLDERVLVYKKAQGFNILSPNIAVIVQQQIDSEIAGVGFSLNPLTNDYDEAVINANWGQGESVVGGLVSPDHFIINKIERQIIEKKLGAKLLSVWLGSDGGTIEREGHRSAELTLSDIQLDEITDVMCRIENIYQKPMDIEWAYADGQLHLLQARPITTYIPLTPEMLTMPGEPRRLYVDAALSNGMTTNAPISPMELDWLDEVVSMCLEKPFRIDNSPEKGLMFVAGSRIYMNLSNMMWLMSPKKMAKTNALADVLLAEIQANIDEKRYRAATRPQWMRFGNLWPALKMSWLMRSLITNTLWAILAPESAHRAIQQKVNAYEVELNENLDYGLSLPEFRWTYAKLLMRQLPTFAGAAASFVALKLINPVIGKKSAEVKAIAEKLQFGFTGNVVVEMGVALFRLAKQLKPTDFDDLTRLTQRVENRQMSAKFLSAWDDFLSTHGWRGPLEMDQASPRYADDPALALRQMSFMTGGDENFDPEIVHQNQVEERRRAYEELMSRLGWFRRSLLRRVHRIIDLFAGYRELPKHHMVLFNYVMRKRVLIEGKHLVQAGRLDTR